MRDARGVSDRLLDWSKHLPSTHELTDAELLAKIRTVHTQSRENYGAPRVYKALKEQGETVGKKRVARLMRENGIVGRLPRRFKKTTLPGPEMAAAIDLIRRSFGAGTIEINRAWCGDIERHEALFDRVEVNGFEPSTSALRTQRSTN